jgi:hypothetical protein
MYLPSPRLFAFVTVFPVCCCYLLEMLEYALARKNLVHVNDDPTGSLYVDSIERLLYSCNKTGKTVFPLTVKGSIVGLQFCLNLLC